MLWFRYRWIPVFSRGLCIKIVRGGDEVKRLSSEIDALFRSPLSIPAGRNIIGKIMKLVNVLDYMVFSVGALLFREEKDLIKFICKRYHKKLITRNLCGKRRFLGHL